MKRILLACLMLGIIAIWITGDEGKEAKANDEIQSLIKQLGDDDWETREKAKEELTKIGEPALELLKQTLKETQEPEVRMRVEWIIKTISFNLMTFININPQGYKEYRHGGTGLVFVLIPGGTFKMGINDGFNYEKPVHEVTVSDFFIAKYEVTQSVWQKIMGNNPASFKKARQSEEAKDVGSENNPVETVSWDDCQEFCKKAGLRLPTESEWEYAARGKTTTKFYWGDDVKQAGDYAWYQDNSKNTTHPVGQKNPNGFGLYDTAGNVWEYCADWYDETYYKNSPKDNPQGPASGNFKAVRGGCWYDIVTELRVSIRGDAGRSLTGRVGDVGFRPAKTK